MNKEEFNLKNRPDLEGLRAETLADAEQEIMECIDWFEGFEQDLPFKLDVLAEQIYTAFKDGCPNVTIARELAQRWADKEIVGT